MGKLFFISLFVKHIQVIVNDVSSMVPLDTKELYYYYLKNTVKRDMFNLRNFRFPVFQKKRASRRNRRDLGDGKQHTISNTFRPVPIFMPQKTKQAKINGGKP